MLSESRPFSHHTIIESRKLDKAKTNKLTLINRKVVAFLIAFDVIFNKGTAIKFQR